MVQNVGCSEKDSKGGDNFATKTISAEMQMGKAPVYISSHQRCSAKKGAPRNFAKFKGKQLCQSTFFNKVAGLRS